MSLDKLRYSMVVAFFLLIPTATYSQPKVSVDTFEMEVFPKGMIAGTHFYSEGTIGPLVLFSGGSNGSQGFYEPVARTLAVLGYHVVTYDLRGHGKSTAPLTNEEAVRGTRLDPPVNSQTTHDGMEIYHAIDLEKIYEYALKLPGVRSDEVILSLSSTSVMFWSREVIMKHSELNKFILLTAAYFSNDLGEYFSRESGFEILSILSEGKGHSNSKGVQLTTKRTEDFFAKNKHHNALQFHCASGYGDTILKDCPSAIQQIVTWIQKVSKP